MIGIMFGRPTSLAFLTLCLCISHSLAQMVSLQPPRNLRVVAVISARIALLSWEPITVEGDRKEFKGYNIQTWTEKDGEENMKEIHVTPDTSRALVDKFVPNSKNYARVLAFNDQYNGPASDTISFNTPEGTPGTIQSFEAIPMGSSALYLRWQPPEESNGVLTGYRVYYQTLEDRRTGPLRERYPRITDPTQTSAKLTGLEPLTKYRIHITATTRAGEGNWYFIEQRTRLPVAVVPDPPQFKLQNLPSDSGLASVKVVWLPNVEGRPGSHFFVKYKKRGESVFEQTDPQMDEDFLIVRGLKPGENYEMQVVAVDGEFMTESRSEDFETYVDGGVNMQPQETVATAALPTRIPTTVETPDLTSHASV